MIIKFGLFQTISMLLDSQLVWYKVSLPILSRCFYRMLVSNAVLIGCSQEFYKEVSCLLGLIIMSAYDVIVHHQMATESEVKFWSLKLWDRNERDKERSWILCYAVQQQQEANSRNANSSSSVLL